MANNKPIVKKKSKETPKIDEVRISINSSFNNTIITANAYHSGNVLAWTSSGASGFKGTKKGTPYAATMAMKAFIEKLKAFQPSTIHVFVSGAGNGRDAALRALSGSGFKLGTIRDITPLPHNGCRAKKARRV